MITLSLGIGASAVLFSILDGAYIHFGQTEQANRAILLTQQFTRLKSESWRFSAPEYFDIRNLHGTFDGFFALIHFNPTLDETIVQTENPERIPAIRATANIFELYGISAIHGRVVRPEEDLPGGDKVAVVTYRLWTSRFGRNPAIIGQTLRLDGVPYTIIGITPRRFQQWGADLLVPLQLDPASANRSERTLTVAGIPKPGVTLAQARAELQVLASRVEATDGGSNPEYGGLSYVPLDIRSAVVGDLKVALYVLLAAAAFLLLIAATNIASLMLTRIVSKAGDIGVRLALGASPLRVARQFLAESLLLGGVSGVLGFGLGVAALKPVLALIPDFYIGEEADVHASASAFLVSIGVALTLSVIFGLAAVFFVTRRGVTENLSNRRTRSVTDRRGGRARSVLVLSEMALAFVVVAGAGLMARTYRALGSLDFGFRPDHVLTLRIALPEAKYKADSAVSNFSRELLQRVRALPGVSNAALTSNLPMYGSVVSRDFSIPGRSLTASAGRASSAYRVISSDYFSTLGTSLIEGRFFDSSDDASNQRVAIVNENFAHTWFPNEDVVGKQIQLHSLIARQTAASEDRSDETVQIIGVVKDARQVAVREMRDLYLPPSPEIFVPLYQHAGATLDLGLLVRTASDPTTATDPVRRQVRAIDAGQPVYDVQTLQELTDNALGPARLALVLLGIFAGIALLIASVGLYAIVAYAVSQRRQEIGIRMALGARREDVLRLMIRQGMIWAGSGLALGLVASLALTRLMSALLYGVRPNDAATFFAVSIVLVSVALLASYVPARKAAEVDPMVALRAE